MLLAAACGVAVAAQSVQRRPRQRARRDSQRHADGTRPLDGGSLEGRPAVYFISYTLADRQYSSVSGSNGALLSSSDDRGRWLEVQTRTGSYQLDDTHKLADRQPSWTSPGTSASSTTIFPCCAAKSGARPTGSIAPRPRR